jgi:hypothetical protein
VDARADVRVGRDDDIRPERPQLARDFERKGREEDERRLRKQPKSRVARALAGVEPADLELRFERVPLAREPRREGEGDPPAADEQDARLRQAAASSRTCAKRV